MATVTRVTTSDSWSLTLDMEGAAVDDNTISPTTLNPSNGSYSPSTTPPVEHYLAEELTGDSGTPEQTINLTSWEDIEGLAKDSSGKKVQEVRIQASANNAAAVTVEGGDTNPYELFGSGLSLDVEPGGKIFMRFADQLADISAAAKNIKFTIGHGDVATFEALIG